MLPQEPFDYWNIVKKRLHFLVQEPFFQEGEIWWCAMGMNIGHEYNGKNDNFERPALILVKINMTTAWILPLTSKEKDDPYRFSLDFQESQVVLSQIKTISSLRLLRLVTIMPKETYMNVLEKFMEIIIKTKLRPRLYT